MRNFSLPDGTSSNFICNLTESLPSSEWSKTSIPSIFALETNPLF